MQRVWSTYYNSENQQQGDTHSRESSMSVSRAVPAQYVERNYSHPRRAYVTESPQAPPSTHATSNLTPQTLSHDNFRLDPPAPPFSSQRSAPGSMRSVTPPVSIKDGGGVSLTVNYLPTKFSGPLSQGIYKRKGKGVLADADVPKRGGGREAFRRGEARMPGAGDEDYDGVIPREGGKTKPRLRWNRFKWTLFITNTILTLYSIVGVIFCLLTWFNVWTNADVIRVGNRPELILSTLAASMGVLTALIGWSGILLNNRTFLAVYTLFLWVTFALLVAPGYLTYRRRSNNLEGKINAQWSRDLGIEGRLRIQNELVCCGYFSPFSEATVSQTCYSRSRLPGCKGPYLKFQRATHEMWYTVVFSIVPAQIGVMVAALLCANHVTYRFGKGMMPKAYRLSHATMAVIMENYANQIAEQYGPELAEDVVRQYRAQGVEVAVPEQMDAMPNIPYASEPPYTTQPDNSDPYARVLKAARQDPHESNQYPRRT